MINDHDPGDECDRGFKLFPFGDLDAGMTEDDQSSALIVGNDLSISPNSLEAVRRRIEAYGFDPFTTVVRAAKVVKARP